MHNFHNHSHLGGIITTIIFGDDLMLAAIAVLDFPPQFSPPFLKKHHLELKKSIPHQNPPLFSYPEIAQVRQLRQFPSQKRSQFKTKLDSVVVV